MYFIPNSTGPGLNSIDSGIASVPNVADCYWYHNMYCTQLWIISNTGMEYWVYVIISISHLIFSHCIGRSFNVVHYFHRCPICEDFYNHRILLLLYVSKSNLSSLCFNQSLRWTNDNFYDFSDKVRAAQRAIFFFSLFVGNMIHFLNSGSIFIIRKLN